MFYIAPSIHYALLDSGMEHAWEEVHELGRVFGIRVASGDVSVSVCLTLYMTLYECP